jgi:hypothetical protein
MTQAWISPFLEQLTATGNVSLSASTAGIATSTAYTLKRHDADFAAAWDQALEDAADTLEAEARRRAVQGVQEPVVYQGQLTPVWARNPDGSIVMEAYEVTDKDGGVTQHERPVQQLDEHGRPVWLTITKYSDSLLALLLKGRRKQVFAERTELTGADGGEVKVVDSTARAARVAHLMALAAKRKAGEDFTDLA